jgi:hypothetical protein
MTRRFSAVRNDTRALLCLLLLGATMISGCSSPPGAWSRGTTNQTLLDRMDPTGQSPYRQGGIR